MIGKASIYTMNALNKLSELWHTSAVHVNRKARPVVEGEHDKSLNDHGMKLNLIHDSHECLFVRILCSIQDLNFEKKTHEF